MKNIYMSIKKYIYVHQKMKYTVENEVFEVGGSGGGSAVLRAAVAESNRPRKRANVLVFKRGGGGCGTKEKPQADALVFEGGGGGR